MKIILKPNIEPLESEDIFEDLEQMNKKSEELVDSIMEQILKIK